MRPVLPALLLALAACAPHVPPEAVTPDATADLGMCGRIQVPPDIVALSEAVSPLTLPIVRDLHFRPGHLSRAPAAGAHVAATLQPLDLILVSLRANSAGQIMRGFLTHAALYLGTEEQLRTAGLWDTPALSPHHDAIRQGHVVIEAMGRPVEMTTLDQALDADAAVVLRPGRLTQAQQAATVTRAIARLGVPFDNRFDAGDDSTLFCTELVDLALPDLALPRDRLYARDTILPDQIARAALDGNADLTFITFVHADRDGWAEGSAALLRATIAANWSNP